MSIFNRFKKKSEMNPVQIRLTEEQIDKIDKLVKRGVYPNRSEAIRDAVRKLYYK